ncbi:MAG TPA: L-threonylcarbamoyladenylate synthase, partial [Actinomycetota bacterium]|nr:L-threonylcarbamoyladenylate synthase [Actinomycetota bacterium]
DISGATSNLFEAKRRPRDLTLPVLNAELREAESVAAFDDRARLLATRFWPGGVTIVLPRTPAARVWDLGGEVETVGVRIPAHDIALAILERTGPLAVTSANLSGQPTPPDCEGVRRALGEAVAVYLCAGECAGTPSTVVDVTGPTVRIMREGAVRAADIMAALEPGSGSSAAEDAGRRR